jgi:hypothetical protein
MNRGERAEFELLMTSMGVPKWLEHLRKFNKLQNILALGVASLFVYAKSFLFGVGYMVSYHLINSAIMAVGLTIVQHSNRKGPFVWSVILATCLLLCLNVGSLMYLAGYLSI